MVLNSNIVKTLERKFCHLYNFTRFEELVSAVTCEGSLEEPKNSSQCHFNSSSLFNSLFYFQVVYIFALYVTCSFNCFCHASCNFIFILHLLWVVYHFFVTYSFDRWKFCYLHFVEFIFNRIKLHALQNLLIAVEPFMSKVLFWQFRFTGLSLKLETSLKILWWKLLKVVYKILQ